MTFDEGQGYAVNPEYTEEVRAPHPGGLSASARVMA